jgi:PAS domain S-box-containing protein
MATRPKFAIFGKLSFIRFIPITAWLSLALVLLTTALAVLLVHHQDKVISNSRFDEVAQHVRTEFLNRMSAYETTLRGSAGLFSMSDGHVSRTDWKEYVDNLNIDMLYPGIQGIGFIEVLRTNALPAHERRVRAEGLSDYHVQPRGNRAEYAVVLYQEPTNSRNRRALGYDLLTRPVARAAMELARDSGLPVQSGKLKLVSDTDSDSGPGFHMYWPIYRKGVAIDTVEARRDALLGYVFAAVRINDLVRVLFRDGLPLANLSVYEGSQASAENLLYGPHPVPAAEFQKNMSVDMGGKKWLLNLTSTPDFQTSLWQSSQVIALLILAQIGGLVILFQISSMRERRREGEVSREFARQTQLREERFRLVVEASPSAIIVTNAAGQMELVNRQVEKLFGYSRDELLGQQVEMLIPDRFRTKHPQLRKNFIGTPSTRAMGAGRDLFARTKSGKDIPIEIGLNPVRTEEGMLVLSSIIDISERKAAEARAHEQSEQIAAASRYKSEFLANMSHELRTPLNSILILSEQLIANKKGNLSSKQIAHADIIHRSGRDLLNLINDILDLSKIEAGRMSVLVENIVIADFAESVEHAFRPMTEAKGLEFKVDLDQDVVASIQSDHQRIFQIIRNLFSNALKFTKTGSIRIRFCRPRSGENGPHAKHVLAISVIDTGIGIPSEKHEMIFEAFQQVDGSTSRRFGGTGLGLTISRQLSDLLGGAIDLKSEPGIGSTFTLYLPDRSPGEKVEHPVDQEQTAVADVSGTPNGAPTSLNQAKPIILVVENDGELAHAIAATARDYGLTPRVVRNGAEALHVVESEPPAAIILDLRLPDANGWSLLRELKANPACRRLPVHVISGVDHPSILFDGLVGYLVKPVAIVDMKRAFAELRTQLHEPLKRVLLVEDNPVECEHYAELIGELGYEVVVSTDGRTALKCCREESFGGMVVDLNLPDMSGFELLDTLKLEGLIGNTGIIINTGLDLGDAQLQKLREFSVTVLTKSIADEQRLIEAVRTHLNRLAPASVQTAASAPEVVVADKEDDAGPATASMAGKRVLVVDDDIRNIYAMCSVLEEIGLETETTMNGEEALHYLKEHNDIDLVLMDMMMPVLDGYAATRELKTKRNYTKPIIAITAHAMKGDREKCLEAGADDYLAKPVTNAELLGMLNKWLNTQK